MKKIFKFLIYVIQTFLDLIDSRLTKALQNLQTKENIGGKKTGLFCFDNSIPKKRDLEKRDLYFFTEGRAPLKTLPTPWRPNSNPNFKPACPQEEGPDHEYEESACGRGTTSEAASKRHLEADFNWLTSRN